MSEYIVECQNTLLHVYVRIHWSACSVHQRTHVVRRQKFYFSGFNSVQTYSVLFKEFMQFYLRRLFCTYQYILCLDTLNMKFNINVYMVTKVGNAVKRLFLLFIEKWADLTI